MSNEESKPNVTTAPSNAPTPRRNTQPGTGPLTASSQANDEKLRETALKAKHDKRDIAEKAELKKFESSLKEYLYTGPQTSMTFGNGQEVQLHPGEIVKLPPDEKYTERLLDRGYATDDAAQISARRAEKKTEA